MLISGKYGECKFLLSHFATCPSLFRDTFLSIVSQFLNLYLDKYDTVWKNEKFSLTEKNSSNQLFGKTIAFTKFLRKNCEREFLQLTMQLHLQHSVEITEFYCHGFFTKIPSN